MSGEHYQTFKGRGLPGRRYRFRLVAGNGEVVGPSQGYGNAWNRDRGILDHCNAARAASGSPTLATLEGVDVRPK